MNRLVPAVLLIAACAGLFAGPRDVIEGNPGSSVKVVIYEDLQCSDCQQFRTLLDQKVLARYGSRVAFIHRDFPLGKHDWARMAAIAGRWVYEHNPETGLNFRREIMSEQNNITKQNLSIWLAEFATRNKLNSKEIVESLNDSRLMALVDQDYQGGIARGVSKTPTVYIGNQPIVETIVYEDLARAIDQALAK